MEIMASGIARGRVRLTMTTTATVAVGEKLIIIMIIIIIIIIVIFRLQYQFGSLKLNIETLHWRLRRESETDLLCALVHNS